RLASLRRPRVGAEASARLRDARRRDETKAWDPRARDHVADAGGVGREPGGERLAEVPRRHRSLGAHGFGAPAEGSAYVLKSAALSFVSTPFVLRPIVPFVGGFGAAEPSVYVPAVPGP